MHKFLRLNSWASAVCSFGKINECLFIPNCKRKIIWLLVDNIQVSVSRFSILCDKWSVKLLQLYWMKIWHVNSSIKIHSLSQSHAWKQNSFFYLWRAVFIRSWIDELNHKANENLCPCGFDAAFYATVFRAVENFCVVCKASFSTFCFVLLMKF